MKGYKQFTVVQPLHRLLTDKSEILSRWEEHFSKLLSTDADDVINSLPQHPVLEEMNIEPSLEEVTTAIKQLSSESRRGKTGYYHRFTNKEELRWSVNAPTSFAKSAVQRCSATGVQRCICCSPLQKEG